MKEVESVFATIENTYKDHNLVLKGDVNIDILKEKCSRVNIYMIFCHGFMPQILKPTRVTATTASLSDHIIVINDSNVSCRGIWLSDMSDHFSTFITLKHDFIRTESSVKVQFREVNKKIKLNFFNEMKQNMWESLMAISNTFFDMVNRNFPYKEVTKKR